MFSSVRSRGGRAAEIVKERHLRLNAFTPRSCATHERYPSSGGRLARVPEFESTPFSYRDLNLRPFDPWISPWQCRRMKAPLPGRRLS
ncbi:hypothetical protein B296_00035649 [Ensete ventricosum]|uniref:Uncharacterized protein n=1 Tax=Ensete ventricosum TaxID=4639 RepID=A0A426XRU4_ENSVE|nr:hypothetical protein B296_00035649 [Ensete ventricosum]